MSPKKKKSQSVAAAVQELLLAPEEQDVEDDALDARIERQDDDGDEHADSPSKGAGDQAFDFGQERASKLLEEHDPKYRGKKVSRKELSENNQRQMAQANGSTGDAEEERAWKEQETAEWGDMLVASDDDESGDEAGATEEDAEDSDELAEFESGDASDLNSHEGSANDDSEQDDSDADDDRVGDTDDDDDDGDLSSEQEEEEPASSAIELMSNLDVKREVSKGQAVKRQLLVAERLLECRIQLQKMLTKVNQLPQHDTFAQFKQQGDERHGKALKRSQAALKLVLDQLLQLQTETVNSNADICKCIAPSRGEAEYESDSGKSGLEPCAKKMRVDDYGSAIGSRYEALIPWRNGVIEHWNQRTRLTSAGPTSKSFSGFESSTLKQIEHILSDKDRLHRRAHTKRTAYRVLGKAEVGAEEASSDDAPPPAQDVDEEIFDDDDFYHQLLRELIDRKAADSGATGAHWQQIQKMRSKLKRNVDTRASKGRKTRYDIHAKLVNFMAPIYVDSWPDETKNELFACLFGRDEQEQ